MSSAGRGDARSSNKGGGGGGGGRGGGGGGHSSKKDSILELAKASCSLFVVLSSSVVDFGTGGRWASSRRSRRRFLFFVPVRCFHR